MTDGNIHVRHNINNEQNKTATYTAKVYNTNGGLIQMFIYSLPFKSIAYVNVPITNRFEFISWSFNITEDMETIVCLITTNTSDENNVIYIDELTLTIQ